MKMAVVDTDMGLRLFKESARRIRFEPASPITATNVQQAIEQVQAQAVIAQTTPPTITPTVVTFAMSPYAVISTDYLLEVNTTGGAITITMPAANTRIGKPLEVKDTALNASVNNISFSGTIEGQTPYKINSDGGALTLRPNAAASAYEVVTW
jgi:hypothetical protein